MIRVLIADDHAIVREGLKQILSDVPDMTVVDEAFDGEEALRKARTDSWDVLVLDLAMPGRSGFEILEHLKSERPHKPVLVLSMHAEEMYAVRVLKAGASGYLTKESTPLELVKAIRKVLSGGRYVSAQLAETLAFRLDDDTERPLHESLSQREFQVLCMMADGMTVSEIAAALSLSAKTVSTYRARILQKLHLNNSAEAIRYALDNYLID
jgi:two-component system, NarL family, invasion response regulator UvrY